MIDDDAFEQVLRSALPPSSGEGPARDLWPSIVGRIDAPARWMWLDLGLAAAVTVLLLVFPEWLTVLAYHL
jgi:hypothetical protein